MAAQRAIIWAAVSSEEQAKDDKTSLDTQERDARQFADQHDMTVIDVLIVGGFSRRFFSYADFVDAAALDEFYDPARMWEHWKRRDFDVLIARDGSRFGREQSIFSEFVARTIDAGARLYMLTEGWIDKTNFRMYSAMGGYGASTQVDRLREGAQETKLRNAARGLTTSGRPPYSHKWVRDEAGNQRGLKLDESKRRLWDDLATVFLEGVSYRHIEAVLYERFGHVDERTGQPFKRYFAYHALHNPIFWGNGAKGYKASGTKNGQKVGAWVYDPSCPAPEGVHIFYGVIEPVYTGEIAGRVQDELRRRAMAIQGTARPYRTNKFTGLLLCGYCAHYMVYDGDGFWRCQSYRTARRDPKCDRFRHVSDKKVQAWLHARLEEMLQQNAPDLLAKGDERPDLTRRIDTLRSELDSLQAQARALVQKQSQAHAALTSIYDEQLQTLGERIEIVERELAAAEREEVAQDTRAAVAAYHDLPENLADLWEWEGAAINQMLHRLMGRRRLVVLDGQIVGTDDAPPHPNRKERKRTYFGRHGKQPS